jgi:hypothetical protein
MVTLYVYWVASVNSISLEHDSLTVVCFLAHIHCMVSGYHIADLQWHSGSGGCGVLFFGWKSWNKVDFHVCFVIGGRGWYTS